MYENPYHSILPQVNHDFGFSTEKLAELDRQIDFSRTTQNKKNIENLSKFEQEITTMKKVIKKRF
jgi:hypothetical protein